MSLWLTSDPKIDCWNFMAARHYGICKIELAVEFERARLDGKAREVVPVPSCRLCVA
jgi:hypothetical protein